MTALEFDFGIIDRVPEIEADVEMSPEVEQEDRLAHFFAQERIAKATGQAALIEVDIATGEVFIPELSESN